MDDRRRELWDEAHAVARRFLGRWGDAFTRGVRDDLAQDAAMACWRYAALHRQSAVVPPVVRAISRRLRVRAVRDALRCDGRVAESDVQLCTAPLDEAPTCLRVQGVLVPRDWLLLRLATLLARIGAANRRLVLGFYDGSSCAELGARTGLTEQAVKVRLHRCRTLLKRQLEGMTRAAGHFER